MNIELTGRDDNTPEILRDRLELKLGKIEQRLGEKLFIRVKLDSDSSHSFSCGIHFQGAGHEFNANSKSGDIIKAADEAVSKIERQVTKFQQRPVSNRNMSIRDQPSIDQSPEVS